MSAENEAYVLDTDGVEGLGHENTGKEVLRMRRVHFVSPLQKRPDNSIIHLKGLQIGAGLFERNGYLQRLAAASPLRPAHAQRRVGGERVGGVYHELALARPQKKMN